MKKLKKQLSKWNLELVKLYKFCVELLKFVIRKKYLNQSERQINFENYCLQKKKAITKMEAIKCYVSNFLKIADSRCFSNDFLARDSKLLKDLLIESYETLESTSLGLNLFESYLTKIRSEWMSGLQIQSRESKIANLRSFSFDFRARDSKLIKDLWIESYETLESTSLGLNLFERYLTKICSEWMSGLQIQSRESKIANSRCFSNDFFT